MLLKTLPAPRASLKTEQRPKFRIADVLSFARLATLFTGRAQKPQPAPARAPKAAVRDPAPRSTSSRPAAAREPAGRKPDAQGPAEGRIEAEGRKRERARLAGILCSGAGQRNFELAKALAFETRMTPKEVIAVLEATPPPAPRGSFGHPERAARNPRISAGGETAAPPAHAIARSWDRAMSEANGTARRPADAPAHGRRA